MSRINVLDKSTINQIAAGEVIDRPASIIKELVENSIDAGATAVSVEIKGGGIDLIRITDNGSGIEKDDIRVAFIRHTTSKIKTAEDLSYITSLGFRGEALASIAAVADVELITKTKDELSASRFLIGGGEEKSFEDIGAPNGTTFIIRDVFKYVPVRRKFLKSSATEGSYCNEIVERIALSHPEVSIKYINNGRNIIFTNGSSKMKDIIFGIYGRDVASEIIELNFVSERNIKVSGCICRPVVVRNNRNTENYFVNGRFIRNQVIFKAIEDAYQPFLMQHKYPFTALYINIDPATMDVNVHPSKQEVRFENPEAVYNAVYTAVTEALSDKALIHKAERNDHLLKEDEERKKQYIPEPFEVNLKKKISEGNGTVTVRPAVREEQTVKEQPVAYGGQVVKEQSVKYEGQIVKNQPAVNEVRNVKEQSLIYGSQIAKEQSAVYEEGMVREQPAVYEEQIVKGQNNEYKEPEKRFEINEIAEKREIVENIESPEHIELRNNAEISEKTDLDKSTEKTDNKPDVEVKYKQASLFDNDNNIENDRERHIETRSEFNSVFAGGYRIVGQIFATYWIIESGGCAYIIDQHAAHEKVLYEKFMKNIGTDNSTQLLSPPLIISLSSQEEAVAQEYRDELTKYGFVLEHFGGHEYALSEIPLNLYGLDAKTMLLELLDELANDIKGSVIKSIKEKIATCACKAAVKGNTELSEAEVKELLKMLLEAENPFNCPHGRPVIIDVTKHEIEKKFKRIL